MVWNQNPRSDEILAKVTPTKYKRLTQHFAPRYVRETMDDSLLAEFQSTFMIGGDVVTNTHGPHPHYTLYKQRGAGGTFGNQEERRKKFLAEQKARRKNYADYARRVVEGNLSDEEDDEMEEGAFDEVDEGTQAASGQEKPPAANGEDKQVGVFA